MKSAIASLRSLTLPFGSTSGARIVLDGINGVIQIYDANNNLALELTPEILVGPDAGEAGFIVYDDSGTARIVISAPSSAGASAIDLNSGSASEISDGLGGVIAVTDTGGQSANYMQISPGHTGFGSLLFNLISANADNSGKAFMQVEAALDNTALRPYIDLSGTSAPTSGQWPEVIVSEILYGTPGASVGVEPTRIGSYPRGLVAYGEETTDVVLSTTTGTYTTLVETGTYDVIAGRQYRLNFSGGQNMLTGGSGFAVGDHWSLKFQRSLNGGAYVDIWGPQIYARNWVAIAYRHPLFAQQAYYAPAGSGSVSWRAVAAKTSGSALITSEVETSLGTTPLQLGVEDVGLAV